MKIISCYINNFGKISEKEFLFKDGLNVFCENNGWGKSTLAAFIKVMFYGFENERSRDDFENERKRFRPWQGGVYGGKITFETNGRRYTVLRLFATKEKDDKFVLIDADKNIKCDDFSSNIGEELFQIDVKSFSRTFFISQNDCETFSTDRINAKIGNIAENTDDINNYENVSKRFNDLLNSMSPTRKTGSINKLRNDISELKMSVRTKKIINESIQEKINIRQRLLEVNKNLRQEQANLREKQKSISEEKDFQAKRERYLALRNDFAEKKSRLDNERRYFPTYIPDSDEINTNTLLEEKMTAKRNQLEAFEPTSSEREQKERLGEIFKNAVPQDDEINEIFEKIEQLNQARLDYAKTQLNDSEKQRLDEIKLFFSKYTPDANETENVITEWNGRIGKKNSVNTKKAAFETLSNIYEQKPKIIVRDKKGNGIRVALLIIGLLLLLAGGAGAALDIVSDLYIKIAAAGIMGLLGMVLVIIGLVKKKEVVSTFDSEAEHLKNLQQEIDDEEDGLTAIDDAIAAYLKKFDIPFKESTATDELYRIKNNRIEFLSLLEKEKNLSNSKIDEKSHFIENEIEEYLSRFCIESSDNNYSEAIYTLKKLYQSYLDFQARDERKNQTENEYLVLNNKLNEYISELGMQRADNTREQLADIRNHMLKYNEYLEDLEKSEKIMMAFENSEDMDRINNKSSSDESLSDLEIKLSDIQGCIEETSKKVLSIEQEIDRLNDEADIISENEEKLKTLEHQYETDIKKYKLYGYTMGFMKLAKEAFTAKYMKPLMNAFKKYYNMMTNDDSSKFTVNANSNFYLEEQGLPREPKFLSCGYQNMIGICMRMALVSAMYQNEKPLIIFDDPFVNLDAAKTDGGMRLLDNISSEYQVIYFTCHDTN